MTTLMVVSGGLREPSSTRLLADRITGAVTDRLSREGTEATTSVVDLRRFGRSIMDAMLTGFAGAELEEIFEALARADGLIAVTPAFNASFSGLFKSFFDVLPEDALAGRPVLIGATGGTARHSLALEHALRPMFVYLRGVVVPTAVFAATEDWAGGTADGALRGRIERAGRELAEEVARRPPATPADPFALTTSFEQLLNGE